jgi:hypothetical protein
MRFTGKCSTFGGPDDTGVGPQEGLALIQPADMDDPWFARNFLRFPEYNSALGLGRNLDPEGLYCAMRWDEIFDLEIAVANELARWSMVRLSFGEKHVWLQPVDYGPGNGKEIDGSVTMNTRRLVDASPRGLRQVGATTDDEVIVEVFE